MSLLYTEKMGSRPFKGLPSSPEASGAPGVRCFRALRHRAFTRLPRTAHAPYF